MSFTCNQELDLIRAGGSRYDLQERIWEGGSRNRSAKSEDLEMRFRQRELERIIGKGSQTGRQVTEVWKSARSREKGPKRAPFRSFLEIETLRKTLISTVSVVDRRQKTEGAWRWVFVLHLSPSGSLLHVERQGLMDP